MTTSQPFISISSCRPPRGLRVARAPISKAAVGVWQCDALGI